MLNISFLACYKVELWDLTVCFAINGEKIQSRAVRILLGFRPSYFFKIINEIPLFGGSFNIKKFKNLVSVYKTFKIFFSKKLLNRFHRYCTQIVLG